MAKKDMVIDFKIGIHSRPAAMLVQKIRSFPGISVYFTHGEKRNRGDSLIGLLQLGITEGAEISIEVEGENEQAVLEEIAGFLKNEVAQEA